MNLNQFIKQLRRFQSLRMTERSFLFAKIRTARSLGFKPGGIANFVLPEMFNSYGVSVADAENRLVFLVKPATKQEKYDWLQRVSRGGASFNPRFFSQHFWLAIDEEEVILVLQGFLQPINME